MSKHQFKTGDRVRSLIDYRNSFTIGKIYIVGDLDKALFPNKHLYIEKDDSGEPNGLEFHWFELAYIKEFSNKLEELINE